MKISVVGVTGLVGKVIRDVLTQRSFPYSEFIPVASERSVGKKIEFEGKEYTIVGMAEAVSMRPDIAIFSAGGDTSLEWAPKFADAGTVVIDNSSAWRMDPSKPLVVPEINAEILSREDKIIANPNCSTIQMVLALSGLHKAYGLKRLVISTYQSYTGTGAVAVNQYEKEKVNAPISKEEMAYAYPIFANCLPQCDVFLDNDYTKEEMKLVNETRKILGDALIGITATAVRVPVSGGHSEAVNVEFQSEYDISEVRSILDNTPGVCVLDDPENLKYPMPLFSKDKDEVFVGRIRRDDSIPNGLNLWIVADNLRKGAATNAIQIAEYLVNHKLVS